MYPTGQLAISGYTSRLATQLSQKEHSVLIRTRATFLIRVEANDVLNRNSYSIDRQGTRGSLSELDKRDNGSGIDASRASLRK